MPQEQPYAIVIRKEDKTPVPGVGVEIVLGRTGYGKRRWRYSSAPRVHRSRANGEVILELERKLIQLDTDEFLEFKVIDKIPGMHFDPNPAQTPVGASRYYGEVTLRSGEKPEPAVEPDVEPEPAPVPAPVPAPEPSPVTQAPVKKVAAISTGTQEAIAIAAAVGVIGLLLFLLKR
jgi:hypothetical protein